MEQMEARLLFFHSSTIWSDRNPSSSQKHTREYSHDQLCTTTVMKVRDNPVDTTSYNSHVTSLLPAKEKIQREGSSDPNAYRYISHLTSQYPVMPPRQLNLGMVVHSDFHENRLVSSLAKPGSSCSLTDFVVLDDPSRSKQTDTASSLRKSILKDHKETKIQLGETGFEALLKSNIDAIYIYVPAE